MAKTIVALCDPCGLHDERTNARSFVIALDNGKPLEIDLCETHEKEMITPLRELLTELGQRPDSVPAVSGGGGDDYGKVTKDCPTCPPGRTLTREGLRGHMRKIHNLDRPGANEVVRSVFGGSARPGSADYSEPCPECKAEGTLLEEEYTYDTPQGLGAHRRSAHGVVGGSDSATRARDAA